MIVHNKAGTLHGAYRHAVRRLPPFVKGCLFLGGGGGENYIKHEAAIGKREALRSIAPQRLYLYILLTASHHT